MLQIQKLGHGVLQVSDLDRSERFYTGVLGFVVAARTHVAFKIGDSTDELRQAKTHLDALGVEITMVADHSVSQSTRFGLYRESSEGQGGPLRTTSRNATPDSLPGFWSPRRQPCAATIASTRPRHSPTRSWSTPG
jgi:catechol 2,3-dioxygenase-like lactoylglutathione lyase family enzyme